MCRCSLYYCTVRIHGESFFLNPRPKIITLLMLQSCLTLCDPMDCVARQAPLSWDFPGKNTGVGCHFLLQGFSQPKD